MIITSICYDLVFVEQETLYGKGKIVSVILN